MGWQVYRYYSPMYHQQTVVDRCQRKNGYGRVAHIPKVGIIDGSFRNTYWGLEPFTAGNKILFDRATGCTYEKQQRMLSVEQTGKENGVSIPDVHLPNHFPVPCRVCWWGYGQPVWLCSGEKGDFGLLHVLFRNIWPRSFTYGQIT